MLTIFLRYLRDKWISILVYILASVAFMWMYVGMFPSIQRQAESYEKIAQAFPEAMMKAFGIETFSINKIENFLSIEQFSLVWPLMLILLLVALSSNAISREIEKGTIEHMLARPVSRLKIFFGKYFVGLVALICFVAVSIFAIAPLAALHNVQYSMSHFVTLSIIGLLFGWAILSIAMMLSAFFSDKGRVAMITGSLLIVMYVLNIISGLKESLKNLSNLSFFHFFSAEQALVKNVISEQAILVFIGVAIVCTIIGAWRFNRRDIAV